MDETQISISPEATRHHNSTKLLILLPLRAILLHPFQYDTPCNTSDGPNPIMTVFSKKNKKTAFEIMLHLIEKTKQTNWTQMFNKKVQIRLNYCVIVHEEVTEKPF